MISWGFQAPTGSEPSLERKRNLSPPPSGQIPEYAPVFCKKVKTNKFYVVSSTVHHVVSCTVHHVVSSTVHHVVSSTVHHVVSSTVHQKSFKTPR